MAPISTGKPGREDAAEIVAKAHAGPAHAGRVELVEQRAHAGRDASRAEAEREAQQQHRRAADRQQQIGDRRRRRSRSRTARR